MTLTKRNENFHFKYYKKFEIDSLKKYIAENIEFSINEEEYGRRQFDFNDPLDGVKNVYKNILPITLIKLEKEWEETGSFSPVIVGSKELIELCMPIIKDLEIKVGGKCGEAALHCLLKNSGIAGHYDIGFFYENARKFHIPISTSGESVFYVEKSSAVFLEGYCWEVNNAKYHEVKNDSEYDRIHLVVEIIPNDLLRNFNAKD